jgi:hypothetical protein
MKTIKKSERRFGVLDKIQRWVSMSTYMSEVLPPELTCLIKERVNILSLFVERVYFRLKSLFYILF